MDNKQLIASELAKVIDSLDQSAISNLLEQPKSSDLGDIAFPAFSLAKVERKAPQSIAADIAEKIDPSHFEKVVATGPYVNFFLNKAKISDQVIKEVIKEGADYGQQNEGQGGNITIDLSSPNIAKPFSVGHLRSTVIGDALSNIFRKMGYNTIKINHLGDWGKQFGLLMVAYKKWGNKEAVEANPIDELLQLYVRINAEIDNDPALDEEGRLWFKKLEDGDPEATELWQWFRDESLVEFNRIYELLGVEFDSLNGEAFYNDKMDEAVKILEEKGLLKESKGASIVDLDDVNLPPAMIKKSDGATLYITRDIATAMYRARTYNFVKNVYVVGQEQSNHFRQLKAVLKKMGFDWSDDMIHVKETSSFWNQLCKKRSAVQRLKLKRKIQIWKTKKLLPMQLVSVPLNSTTLRLTAAMVTTLIWKQWFPLKVKLDRMCSMLMHVSSLSYAKQTSSQVLMPTTTSTMLKAGKLSNCSKTSLA